MKCNVLNIDSQGVIKIITDITDKTRFSKHPTNNNVMCVREKYVYLCVCVILCVIRNVYICISVIS